MANYPYDPLQTPLDLQNLETTNRNFEEVAADIASVDSASQQRDNAIKTDYTFKMNVQKNEYTGRLNLQNERIDNIVSEVSGEAFNLVVDSAKLTWRNPVDSFANLAGTYPTAQIGWSAMVRDTGKVYRFDGNTWIEIQEIDAGPVNAVDAKVDALTQTADLIVTVGTSGDYLTINEALDFLSKKKKLYKSTPLKAQIKMLSGFIMQEQIHVESLDLGWIRLVSEAPVVTINRSALTKRVEFPSYAASSALIGSNGAFIGYNNAVLPIIDVLFEMDETGSQATRDGVFVINNSRALIMKDKGFINTGNTSYFAAQNSIITAMGAIGRNAKGNGLAAFRNSFIAFRGGDASGAGSYGVYADSNSLIEASGANFSNAALSGVWADSCSVISAPDAFINNCIQTGVIATGASIIDVDKSQINNSGQRGLLARDAGVITAIEASILNSGTDGVYAASNGQINISMAVATGAVGKGAYALDGGKINAKGANVRRGLTDSSDDIRVLRGSSIVANESTGGTSQTPNISTSSGIIYKSFDALVTTPTLLEGWTGTLTATKNSAGQVWLRGQLTAGVTTPDKVIATIINGFRPIEFAHPLVVRDGIEILAAMSISTTGALSTFSTSITTGDTVIINTIYQSSYL